MMIASLLLIVTLSVIRVSASKRLRPAPSIAARALSRRPTHVAQIVGEHHRPTQTESTIVALPRPLFKEEEQPDRSLTPIGGRASTVPKPDWRADAQEDEPLPSTVASHTTPPTIEEPETPSPTISQELEPKAESDLSNIEGVGPALADQMVDLGINDIYALAALNEEQTTHLASRLGRHGTKLVNQDWVGQARRLLAPQ